MMIVLKIYKKALIAAFKPIINGEKEYFFTPEDKFNSYFNKGKLNIKKIIDNYSSYVKRRAYKAFDNGNLRESVGHYSFDGYINFFLESIEGTSFIETPTGRGRLDIIIIYNNQKYIIELKKYYNNARLKKGKYQLVEYLKSENLDTGYYVVFSNVHTSDSKLFEEEIIKGKRIYTWIIRTNYQQPSKL